MNRQATTSREMPAQIRVLDAARAIESVALVVISLLLVLAYQQLGLLMAAPLLASAVILRPRERIAPLTREQTLAQLVNRLQTEALELRAQYVGIRTRALSDERSLAQWQARREITIWLAAAESRLKHFPVMGGIFRLRKSRGGLLDDLDACIGGLSEMRRLCELSQRLRLPI